MSNDKTRDQFEKAFAKKTASLPIPDGEEIPDDFEGDLLWAMKCDRTGDSYHCNVFASSWWAWQEALKVSK